VFTKYPSLTNLHNTTIFSNQLSDMVVVTEKIDGSNAQVFASTAGVGYGSRNQLVTAEWNDIGTVAAPMMELAQELSKQMEGKIVTVYGEIFSSKILRRFNYGETRFLAFDIAVDRALLPQEQFLDLVPPNLRIPARVMTLQEALEIDIENLPSQFDADGKNAEGIVIKGLKAHMVDVRGDYLAIKRKSEAFTEKASKPFELNIGVDGLNEAQKLLLTYINHSRVYSALSKLGEYDVRRTGEFIKEISEDALKEFLAENMMYTRREAVSKQFNQIVKLTLLEVVAK
jgi:Rnl2 family RNA ligase